MYDDDTSSCFLIFTQYLLRLTPDLIIAIFHQPEMFDPVHDVTTFANLSMTAVFKTQFYHPVYFDHRGFPCDRYPDQMLPQPPAVAMHAASLDA